ncbi:MAG: NAD-dependent epimerase/dehydratase family protein [Gallionella sp.]|nr:NAD-dependent epimerase/dehydratase family protein [Gallionella sp.]
MRNQNILAVGCAGYIGSRMVKYLLDAAHRVVTLGSLVSGHRSAGLGGTFIHADLASRSQLADLFQTHRFDCVMHFASFIQAGESVCDPTRYYRHNVANTQNLLDAMAEHSIRNLIFSSTATIFGEPRHTPIDEAHPNEPINPYGRSKLMVENMLADYGLAYGLKSVCLRFSMPRPPRRTPGRTPRPRDASRSPGFASGIEAACDHLDFWR